MKTSRIAIACIALLLPLGLAACGDDSTGDLSTDEISKSLQDGGLDAKTADCVADDIKDADLTKDELEEFTKTSNVNTKAGKVLTKAMTTCLTGS